MDNIAIVLLLAGTNNDGTLEQTLTAYDAWLGRQSLK